SGENPIESILFSNFARPSSLFAERSQKIRCGNCSYATMSATGEKANLVTTSPVTWCCRLCAAESQKSRCSHLGTVQVVSHLPSREKPTNASPSGPASRCTSFRALVSHNRTDESDAM